MATRRLRFAANSSVRRAVLVLAAVSVLTMPVSYTGGRGVAHPHAFVQLFFDAANGSTSHHRPAESHVHSEPLQPAFILADVPDDTPVVTQTGGSIERIGLISVALAIGFFLHLGGMSQIGTKRSRLLGITYGPDIPPPRNPALA